MEWISVDERLPEETVSPVSAVSSSEIVLVSLCIVGAYRRIDIGHTNWGRWDWGEGIVTHWMPAPELPHG